MSRKITPHEEARKSTIGQKKVAVMALCLHEEDVYPTVVYFNIEGGFGRLLHGGTRLR